MVNALFSSSSAMALLQEGKFSKNTEQELHNGTNESNHYRYIKKNPETRRLRNLVDIEMSMN